MTVSIEVLGPLRLLVDGEERSPGGRRERLVLALLATPPGRHVGDARLVDDVWGEDPPARATSGLQVAISRLRRVLGADAEIRRDPAGYTLVGADVDAGTLLLLADRLPHLAPAAVLSEVDAALARWRGTPYAGLDPAPTLQAEAARLEECRLALLESQAQALLDLGRPQDAYRVLAPIVPEQPFRERLWSLLALALYRCGRQAEALDTLRTLRATLVDELGVDPSAGVRVLEQQLLAQDPALDTRALAPGVTAPGDATRGRVTGVVGRAGAICSIESALAGLVDEGRGGVVLISGDAGIGKSMLAAEVVHRGRERGVRVCVGRCHEADLAPPYWPWLPVLRELAETAPQVPPEVTALLVGSGAEGGEAADPGAAGATTLRTFAAVSRLLGGSHAPLVVVLEDLHWADRTSLRLLAHTAEELRDHPVLLVATVRTVDPRLHPHLGHALAGLARLAVQRVPVPPLDNGGVTELLADSVQDPDPELVEVLTRRTDGNPFFVLEMARLLEARGTLTAEAAERLEVPDGIADVLRLRVAQRPGGTRLTLGAAAVAGRVFDTRLLADVLGRSPLDDLDDATAAGLVEEVDGAGRLRFVHALTRETVYRDLATRQRADWHSRIGRVLVSRLARDPELLGEVAHHHAAAAAFLPEVAADAVTYGSRAAVAAERRGAYEEAVSLWQRSLECESLVPDPEEERRHRMLLSLATARQRIGDMRGSVATLTKAVEIAQRQGHHRRMAEAVTGHRSGGVWHWREIGEHDPQAIEVIEECLDHVSETPLRARLHASLSLELYMAQNYDGSERQGQRSLELARETGDRALLRDCLVAREVALFSPGGTAERERCARESLTVADSPEHEIAARFHLGCALQQLGRGPEGDRAIAPAYALAEQLRYTASDVPLSWFRWLRAVEADSPDAARIGDAALALHRRTTVVGLSELTGLYEIVTAPVGAPVAPDVVAAAADHPFVAFRSVVAHALALTDDLDGALRVRGEVGPLGGDYAALLSGCLTAEILRLAGDDRLEDAVEQIRPYADVMATYGSVYSLGSAALFVGSGLRALGATDEARRHLVQAVAVNRAGGCKPWERVARTRLAELGGSPL